GVTAVVNVSSVTYTGSAKIDGAMTSNLSLTVSSDRITVGSTGLLSSSGNLVIDSEQLSNRGMVTCTDGDLTLINSPGTNTSGALVVTNSGTISTPKTLSIINSGNVSVSWFGDTPSGTLSGTNGLMFSSESGSVQVCQLGISGTVSGSAATSFG